MGGEVAKNTRSDIESKLGESVISKDNILGYQYMDEYEKIENKQFRGMKKIWYQNIIKNTKILIKHCG